MISYWFRLRATLHRWLAERCAKQHRWSDAARHFRQAAESFYAAGDYISQGKALRRAAQSYEALQTWRIAGDTWLATAEALSAHRDAESGSGSRDIGEAYLWAGYTFFWSGQHYGSWRAHLLAGREFVRAEHWAGAERAYRFAAVSKATAFASLRDVNRTVHPAFRDFVRENPALTLRDVVARWMQGSATERDLAMRSYISSLVEIRRALENAGNQDEARELYRSEIDARLKHARKASQRRKWLWLAFYKVVLGYGEGWPNLSLASALLFLVLFPFLYFLVPGVYGATRPWDYIYVSITALTTLDPGDMGRTGWAAWTANLEFLVGLVAFGMLVSILVRLVSR